MKRVASYLLFLSVGFSLTSASFMATIMYGHTGSPGELTCVYCHNSFAINSGPGNVKISSIPAMTGNKYVSGQTYTVQVTVTETGASIFACDAEIIDSLGNNSGTITSISPSAPLQTYLPNGRKNVFGNATQADSVVFSFQWLAPATGEANIYVTGLRADGNETSGNDNVYSDRLLHLKPISGVGIKENEVENSINIFPNPAREYFEIDAKIPGSLYIITDLAGNTLQQGKLVSGKTKIDAGGFQNGIYGLQLVGNGKCVSQKIIIAR
ncbi:MAG: choice-of-anchor V domain-containing protein [Bacteroidia bacterium]